MVVTDSNSCTDSDQVIITVLPLPQANFAYNDTCFSNETLFDNLTLGNISNTHWDFGDDNISNSSAPEHTYDNFGSYIVQLTVIDNNGCRDSITHKVDIQPLPTIIISPYPDTLIFKGQSVQIKSTGGENYIWTPQNNLSCVNCSNPISTPLKTTIYTLSVVDINGCENNDSIIVRVSRKNEIFVPNIFTPNDDGQNDIVFIKGHYIKKLLYWKIFDRWGELMFQTSDIEQGWDGTYKGRKVDMDRYIYLIELEDYGNSVILKKGSITLIR
jgi:gliding motility-associated-like protein